MLKRFVMLAIVMAGCWFASEAQNGYVELNAANFPDAEFRTFLRAKFSKNLKTENGTTYIDRTAVNEINLNFADGTLNNLKVNYTKIKSLEGIKLFVNLQKLTLPAISKTAVYALGDVDVSDMPYLTTVTNTSVQYGISVTANKGGGISGTYKPATKFGISLGNLTADNCPRLSEVTLSGYSSLKSISLEGTTANSLEKLYVISTGLLRLDVSHLPGITNMKDSWGCFDDYWTDYCGITNRFTAMKEYSTFAVDNCSDLTELIIGEHPWKLLSISGCDKLESVDISGLPDLVRFCATFTHSNGGGTSYSLSDSQSHYNCDHTYRNNSGGRMKKITIGEGHRHLRVFTCEGGVLTNSSVDFANMASTAVYINVSYNHLRAFDVTPFTKIRYLDLGYNRIHRLDMPVNKGLLSLGLSDNCLTRMDQFTVNGTPIYSGLAQGGRLSPFQYIRVGSAYRYRIFDDPDDAQYVELSNDDANQKYFWAINGGHIGNPDNDERIFGGELTGRKEDPCYFYFDSSLTDGQYWYRNPYTTDSHFNHGWFKVTLCHSQDIDFDPDRTFYLAGDFNNWQPGENHAMVYNPATEHYELQLDGEELRGDFRIWDHYDPAEVSLDLGGHYSEFTDYPGHDSHIFFATNVEHPVDNDVTRHYTTYKDGEDATTGKGYKNPLVEMKLEPGNGSVNYVRIIRNTPTGIEITAPDSNDAPVELFNLNGIRVNTASPAPGIYIRRQGNTVTKILIR